MMSTAAPAGFAAPTASLISAVGKFSRTLAATLAVLGTCRFPEEIANAFPYPIEQFPVVQTSTAARPRQHASAAALSVTLPHPFRRREKTVEELQHEQSRRRVLDEAWEVFRERYVDESSIDWKRLRRRMDARSVESDEELQMTMHWLFSQTDDPFTRYLTAKQLEAMKDDIDGEMCGVGIVFNAEPHGWRRTKRVIIKHVVRNSPAADAGLLKGDQITAIDMVRVKRMSCDEATRRLLGKEGKKVLISFRRGGEDETPEDVELNVLLTRRRFEVPTVSSEILEAPGVGPIAYLQVREFAANTAAQTRAAVRELAVHRAKLFVLDMRGNSGGLVDKAVEVAKFFLERDRIVVRFVGRDGAMTTERCGWRLFWRPRVHMTKEPMVVLVDGETASASELVAAALQDNCRAVVVGNSTFGKGSVQAIVPLSDGTGVAVTVARYRTPKDKTFEMGKGLRPDLFRSNLAEDGDGAVKELFGRAGARRYKWVVGRLGKCVAPDCNSRVGNGKKGNGRLRIVHQSGVRLLNASERKAVKHNVSS